MDIGHYLAKKRVIIISASALFLAISACRTMGVIGWLLASIANAFFILGSNTILEKRQMHLANIYYLLSIGLCAAIGVNFYQFRMLLPNIHDFLFSFTWFRTSYLIALAIVLGAMSIPSVAFFLSFSVGTAYRDYQTENQNVLPPKGAKWLSAPKAMVILLIIYILGISSILRANVMYIDDVGRVSLGYQEGHVFSRYLFNAILTFLNLNVYASDLSPFSQILALAVMAFTGIMILYVVYERTYFSVAELAAVLPLALNPYFLECLSFKFDAPSMAVSLFGGVFPLLYRKKKTYQYIAMAAVGALVTCTSYQVSIGVFPMMVILIALRMFVHQEDLREIVHFCLLSAIGFCCGVLYYYTFLMVPFEDYVSSQAAALQDMIPTLLKNYKMYWELICSDFKIVWILLILATVAASFVTAWYISKRGKLLTIAVTGLAVLFMGLLCFGIYPALVSPLGSPRAMYGVGVLVSLLCVFTAEDGNIVGLKFPGILLAYAFFAFTLLYGNALANQKEYTDFRIRETIQQLSVNNLLETDHDYWVEISGNIGYAENNTQVIAHYPILERLLPVDFGEGYWESFRFFNHYWLYTYHPMEEYKGEYSEEDLQLISDNIYQKIRASNDVIWIELK